jgi:hypothetical protein
MRRVHGFCCMQPVIVCVTFPLSGQFAFSPAAFSKKHGREDAEGEGEDDTPHRSGARREKRQRAEPQAEEAPAPYVHRPMVSSMCGTPNIHLGLSKASEKQQVYSGLWDMPMRQYVCCKCKCECK